ncbi:carboxypeptidase regulatory-like domain-containing protein [Roseisolibacter sp. H3M3-2]|uniref:carboxypeptidase regulatory-like domain-containing protein n=1 Tax=Roseisolibacter sp. H3M3-2 TaxID=3031323 RepID=UPI0023DB2D31|nr:carboxypeptidase regulatory-like domain-containing protein [Roseisolibacter sp. H3M3-2]MDF1504800.1 carboxypeptidase regulatory-like domain-containing protein [Roseisolibacter sp. H3M3-2]
MRPLLLLALTLPPAVAAAQPQPAVLAGVVTRDVADGQPTGAPLRGVTVAVSGVPRRAATDAGGRFVIGGLPIGTRDVVVQAAGFAPVTIQAELAAGDTTWIDFALVPTGAAAARGTVAAAGEAAGAPGLVEFDRRRKGGGGVYFTRAQIQRFVGRRLTEMLRPIPGVTIATVGGGTTVIASRRGLTSERSNTLCYFQVIVSGVRVYSYDPLTNELPPDLELFDPANLGGVEVYAGGARTPPELNSTGAGCGTLVLWPQTPQ